MGIIKVNNIKLYAYHGCLDEEAKIGSEYRVDVSIKADLKKSAKTDDLTDTVDYVHLNHIVKEEMAIRAKLLEEVAQRILNRIFNELRKVIKAKVSVSKINPPIGGNVEEVVIILTKKRYPKALLAQAAIETGWGQYMIHNTSGQNSHNLFGIKADLRWQGDRAMVNTIEFEEGVAATKKAPFRVYDSFADSMQDYVGFVKQNPRYEEAVKQSQSPQDYFSELQKAGYATDPDYANKVLSVFESKQLKQYLP